MVKKSDTVTKEQISDGNYILDNGHTIHYINSKIGKTVNKDDEILLVGRLYDIFVKDEGFNKVLEAF